MQFGAVSAQQTHPGVPLLKVLIEEIVAVDHLQRVFPVRFGGIQLAGAGVQIFVRDQRDVVAGLMDRYVDVGPA